MISGIDFTRIDSEVKKAIQDNLDYLQIEKEIRTESDNQFVIAAVHRLFAT